MASRAELRLPECLESELLRVRYFPRQLLTADDMQADQDYMREKQRRHNRFCHGWGCVCGFAVTAAPTDEIPWRVQVNEGYALGTFGDEIYLAKPVLMDLALCGPGASTDPCEPDVLRGPSSATGSEVFLAIKYAECVARPVRVIPAGCGCNEEACEYSRISDSFQLECLTELPQSHQPPPGPALCEIIQGRQLPVCPPCPSEPWVVLAHINLPASPVTNITDSNIDNITFRRQIFSTAILQDQLIACCCGMADLVTAVSITNTETIAEGARITFGIEVTNHGPSTARNIVVTDSIDTNVGQVLRVDSANTSLGQWTNTQLSVPTPNAVFVAEITELPVQQTANLDITVDISGTHQSLTNTVVVRSETQDPNSVNDKATVRIPQEPLPDLPI